MGNKKAQDLLQAWNWINGNASVEYDVPKTAKRLKEISKSVYDPKKDGREVLMEFQAEIGLRGISFEDMTKDQQLEMMTAVGRDQSLCYKAFISNAAFRIITLAENNYQDVERICEGFEVEDLRRIAQFLMVMGGKKVAGFCNKFNAVVERKEQELADGPKPAK